jgi:outer membrane receptor for ferrienterochelin and colicins
MKSCSVFIYLLLLSILFPIKVFSIKTDTNVFGHVRIGNHHVPFANISIKGTTLGTLTDETGHFQLVNVPIGEITIVASCMGCETKEITLATKKGESVEIKFELKEDMLNISEVVVSASRNEQKRTDAAVIVSTLSPRLFNSVQSLTLSEGLNFCPGLRLENNCQNCGFTQVRMNGMEGPYSQILINSRPIFSGLAGVYGLELIPSNMIERVEVVRGGASALFGSNAIAGTINLILKDPVINTYELGFNGALVGVGMKKTEKSSLDYSVNFNTSIVSDDRKTGISVYGFTRERDPFDANQDGFSELSPLENNTIGTRFFHRFANRNKFSIDFFSIKEDRAGGNRHDYPLHERDIAEAVEHKIKTGAITYEQFFRKSDLLSVYFSGQHLDRDSYYGANRSLSSYGKSEDQTWNMGVQYKAIFTSSVLIGGIERTTGHLTDKKLGYPDLDNALIEDNKIAEIPHVPNTVVADQSSATMGAFLQYEVEFKRLKTVIGARYDKYSIFDHALPNNEAKTGTVLSPRISFLYHVLPSLQSRLNFSKGYRAPQIFDEDLHIETSGSRQVINVNDPDLKQENSKSISASLDYNQKIGKAALNGLIEGFYTRLNNPFVNEIGTPDENGTVYYTRKNADEGATVKGFNIEVKLKASDVLSLNSGFTIQNSLYDTKQEFDERKFLRTPDQYGFFSIDWDYNPKWCFTANANYTGPMLVPYFGPLAQSEEGELHPSSPFFDAGAKISYTMKLNGASLEWSAGIKNMFNSYQRDFDYGIDRDPAYMYGPVSPRMIYLGIRIGNRL